MGYSATWANPVAVMPHFNWRGLYDAASFDSGTATRCTKDPLSHKNSTDCVYADPAATNTLAYMAWDKVPEPQSWLGRLKDNQRDASGQLYMRNRYYDPMQGRFTQEDPVGLAGGLNLYGFAGGDPVNFSDPFGLQSGQCPPCTITDWSNLKHVLETHMNEALAETKSQFVQMGEEELKGVISTAVKAENYAGYQMRGTVRHVFQYTFDRAVGAEGQTAVRVVLTNAGKLLTAFPVEAGSAAPGLITTAAGGAAGGLLSKVAKGVGEVAGAIFMIMLSPNKAY